MQILKDATRNKILMAAKLEFDKNGIDNTNMRKIALNAKMTVGNLYRYYSSKEELVKAVVFPAYIKVNDIIKKYTGDQLSFDSKFDLVNIEPSDVKQIINLISEELVKLYRDNTLEMRIMMNEEILNDEIKKWFIDLIRFLAFKWNGNDVNRLLCEVLTNSVFEGVRYSFLHAKNDVELLDAIKIFLNVILLSVAKIEEM